MSFHPTTQLHFRGITSKKVTLSQTISKAGKTYTFYVNYDPKADRVIYVWDYDVTLPNGTKKHHKPSATAAACICLKLNWKEIYQQQQIGNAEHDRMLANSEAQAESYRLYQMHEAV